MVDLRTWLRCQSLPSGCPNMTPCDSDLFGNRELAVVGQTITAITLDSNVVIYAGSGREHEFRIENSFVVANGSRQELYTVRYEPYNRNIPIRENLTELSVVVTSTILGARAYVSGVLELDLDNDLLIRVEPMERYEAWTYTFGTFILACPPGGFSD